MVKGLPQKDFLSFGAHYMQWVTMNELGQAPGPGLDLSWQNQVPDILWPELYDQNVNFLWTQCSAVHYIFLTNSLMINLDLNMFFVS